MNLLHQILTRYYGSPSVLEPITYFPIDVSRPMPMNFGSLIKVKIRFKNGSTYEPVLFMQYGINTDTLETAFNTLAIKMYIENKIKKINDYDVEIYDFDRFRKDGFVVFDKKKYSSDTVKDCLTVSIEKFKNHEKNQTYIDRLNGKHGKIYLASAFCHYVGKFPHSFNVFIMNQNEHDGYHDGDNLCTYIYKKNLKNFISYMMNESIVFREWENSLKTEEKGYVSDGRKTNNIPSMLKIQTNFLDNVLIAVGRSEKSPLNDPEFVKYIAREILIYKEYIEMGIKYSNHNKSKKGGAKNV